MSDEEEKEKKRGAPPIPALGGAAGASAGAGASAALPLGVKIGSLLLLSTLGVGAYTVGKSWRIANELDAKNVSAPPTADDKTEAAPIASASKAQGDSLGMVSGGAWDGKSPQQREADAAAALAAKAKNDKEAADAAKAPSADPNAVVQAAMAGAGAPSASAPGAAGAAKGGGLTTKLDAASSKASLSNANFGLSGGVGSSFSSRSKLGGNLRPFEGGSSPGRTAVPQGKISGRGQGVANRQLARAYQYSERSRTGMNETRSANASAAFDGSMPAGSAITGLGASIGGNPSAGTSGSSQSKGSSGPSSSPGTGTTKQSVDCNLLFPNQNYVWSGTQCVPSQTGRSVDPADWIIKLGNKLLMAAAIAAFVQFLVGLALKSPLAVVPYVGAALNFLYTALYYALIAMGIAIAALGVVLLGMGRGMLGTIWVGVGAIISLVAVMGHGQAYLKVYNFVLPLMKVLAAELGYAQGTGKPGRARHYNPNTGNWEDR